MTEPDLPRLSEQPTLSDRIREAPILAYGLAVMAWSVAFALRYVLAAWFPPGFPYLTFFPAVVVVAYYAGLRPAILTALLSGLTAWWYWIGPPGFDFGPATLVALAFFGFVVAVDIFFIVGMDTARRRLRREVRRNAALAESRDLLMREVQHRVSNNIQVVASLLTLEARGAADPGARRALKAAAARTATIARIQRSLTSVDRKATPFAELAREIAAGALAAAGRSDIVLTIAPTSLGLTPDEASPVLLVMLEAVNNALEHGLDRPGRIDIHFTEIDGERRLEVRDDGRGLAHDFDAKTLDSLGMRIVQGLAQQLQGRFALERLDRGAASVLFYPARTA